MTKEIKEKKVKKIPYHYKPEDISYDDWQIWLRRQFAVEQNFNVKNIWTHEVYSDFEVINEKSKSSYKVAIRSKEIWLNFCNCLDFKINTLWTCKHIEYVLNKLNSREKTRKLFEKLPEIEYSSVFVKYGNERQIMIRIWTQEKEKFKKLKEEYFNENWVYKDKTFFNFCAFLESATKIDQNFKCYEDVYDFVVNIRDSIIRKNIIESEYPEWKDSKKLDNLLKVKLYTYQKEAVLKSTIAWRSIIADDMWLWKTIQSIGIAEMMAKHYWVEKVLIICPTSLKYQWKSEIEKFCNRSSKVIEWIYANREEHYKNPEFFNILTYNVVKNDINNIKKLSPDLIILDEAQRIKNWKTKTAQNIKKLKSQYALVLTWTPLENKLEELHSIVEFIDRYKLWPLFRYLANHQILSDWKVVWYKDLHKIKNSISDIMIRRTKKEVLDDLPERIDKNYFVPMTQKQLDIHTEHYDNVCKLVNKWKKFKYLSEKDRQFLMINLNIMRMVCDSTYIIDQKLEERYDTKIEELMELLKKIFLDESSKVVIFSQWERMTYLISRELDKLWIGYQYLHWWIPSIKRKDLLVNFHEDKKSKVFLSTDAGWVWLNLQCANFIVNMDCPWNPAVLEQRIGRVYRLWQKKKVEVINFISKWTIEENMLSTIKFKKSIFDWVLDDWKNEVFMWESKFKQFMKTVENITEFQENEKNVDNDVVHVSETGNNKAQNDDVDREQNDDVDREQNNSVDREQESNTNNLDSMQKIFSTGINFLENFSKALNNKDEKEKLISKFIEKDEKTGKQNFKIPVPEKELVEKITNTLNMFLENFKK